MLYINLVEKKTGVWRAWCNITFASHYQYFVYCHSSNCLCVSFLMMRSCSPSPSLTLTSPSLTLTSPSSPASKSQTPIPDASFLSPPPHPSRKMKGTNIPPPMKPTKKRLYTTKLVLPSIADELEKATRCLYTGCTNHVSNPMLDRCIRHSIHPSPIRNISTEEESLMTTAGYIKCETCKNCWVSEQAKMKLCINCIRTPTN